MSSAVAEIKDGRRFQFGKNWSHFLTILDEERILQAEKSLCAMLEMARLDGRKFLDVGSGSGLFSLAARRLGACVHSFDYDPQSVACTLELRRRYFPDDRLWSVGEGSILNTDYLNLLGSYDIVYSWGVLHHTGEMWNALGNIAPLVAENGKLFIAIYNDQGRISRAWRSIKQFYNNSPISIKVILLLLILIYRESRSTVRRLISNQNVLPFKEWGERKKNRGMSVWHDLVDWVGGFPFEVAKPELIFDFYRERLYTLVKLKTSGGGSGCNEFVFVKKRENPQ